MASHQPSQHSAVDLAERFMTRLPGSHDEFYDVNDRPFGIFKSNQFSQWWHAEMFVDGQKYVCCEQYMMAEKARLFNDQETLHKILVATDPWDHKSLGREVKNFNAETWDQHCFDIVCKGNLAKFEQNADLRERLLSTGKKLLAEGAGYDRVWGIGVDVKNVSAQELHQWAGTNYLGQVLMLVRRKLLEQEIDDLGRSEGGELQWRAIPEGSDFAYGDWWFQADWKGCSS